VKNIFKLFFLIFFINSCSLNPNSSLWTKKAEIKKDKILNTKQITKKQKILENELNTNLKINISNLKIENSNLKNFTNNKGRYNYEGSLKNISRYKFSKIENFNQYEPEIAIDKNNIIFFDNKGNILKFDNKTKLKWKKNNYSKAEKKKNPILFFSINSNYLIVADTLAKYYALDINSGKIIWSKNNNAPFNSQIKIFKDKFFIVDSENVIKCFSIKDGSVIWSFKTEKPFIKSLKKNSLVIKNNKVIFNNSLGDITALDLYTGDLRWQTPTQKNTIYEDALFLKNADLVIGGNSIFLSNNMNDFFSIDVDTGIINWKQKINSELTSSFINNLIFSITNEGYFIIIDNNTGNLIRSTNVLKNIKKRKIKKFKPVGFIVGKKDIYLTTANGRLFVIDISTGVTKSVLKIDGEKISRPIVIEKNLFIIKDNSIIKLN
jgi:outer membrane protein assembly factor BamB